MKILYKLTQIKNNSQLFISMALSSLVIGPFNYYGLKITKLTTSMNRCLIDASRMCIVCFASIIYGWEDFQSKQCIGYFIIFIGNLIYYEVKIISIRYLNLKIKSKYIKKLSA